MIGRHQIDNALTAIETAEIIKRNGFDNLNFVNIYEGIRTAALPLRCQILREKDPMVIVDGAHNPDV
jgi:folylpolyglutamate synthase/dihydropteroate synthase